MMQEMSNDSRPPSEGQSDPERDEPAALPTRMAFASARACVITGVLAFVVDTVLLRQTGGRWGSSVVGGLFVGVFTGYGLWVVTKARRKIRPVDDKPVDRDSSLPPPAGGWANPSGSQRTFGRLGRMFDATFPRRRRRK